MNTKFATTVSWLTVLGAALAAAPAGAAGYPGCPATKKAAAIEKWRASAVDDATSGGSGNVVKNINACFPAFIPGCLQRTEDYVSRGDLADMSLELPATKDPRRRPPLELLVNGYNNGDFSFRDDVEKIAKAKGWPVVRYKSRHSGGFDSETPSLIMIRIPGDKVNPPVDYDRYLNFAIPADSGADELNPIPQAKFPTAAAYAAEANGGPSLPHTFTIVTVQKGAGGKPSRVFFQKNYRNTSGKGTFTAKAPENPASCISCHPSGARQISPFGFHVRDGEKQLPPEQWKAVQEMNDSMEANAGSGQVDWGGAVDPSDQKYKPFIKQNAFGPVYGPTPPLTRKTVGGQTVYPTRTEEFIMGTAGNGGGVGTAGCYNSRTTIDATDIFGRPPGRGNIYTLTQSPPVDWKKVKNAMNCANCHDGDTRGALNSNTNFAQIEFKILVDQTMPNGSHHDPMSQGGPTQPVVDKLNPNERIALVNCLKAEYELESQKDKEWLAEGACSDLPSGQTASIVEPGGSCDKTASDIGDFPLPDLPPMIHI